MIVDMKVARALHRQRHSTVLSECCVHLCPCKTVSVSLRMGIRHPTTPHMIQKAYTRGDVDRLYAGLAFCAIEVNVRFYLRLIRRAPDRCCSRRGHGR